MKYDVFISYSRKDKKRVEEFCELFSNAGISFWIDRDGIENGENFKTVIVKAIEESTVLLFFSSKNSNATPWTAKEVGIAVARRKTIIPIRLDASPYNEGIEFDLINLNALDCTNESKQQEAIAKLLLSIQSRCQHTVQVDDVVKKYQGNRKKTKRWLLVFISACLLLVGFIWIVSYIEEKQDYRAMESQAKAIIAHADRLVENEMQKCYFDDEGVRCFDSISSSQLILAKEMYDSVYSLLPSVDPKMMTAKISDLQDVIDSMYAYFVEKYKVCVETQREYTARFCRNRYLELDNYVSKSLVE